MSVQIVLTVLSHQPQCHAYATPAWRFHIACWDRYGLFYALLVIAFSWMAHSNVHPYKEPWVNRCEDWSLFSTLFVLGAGVIYKNQGGCEVVVEESVVGADADASTSNITALLGFDSEMAEVLSGRLRASGLCTPSTLDTASYSLSFQILVVFSVIAVLATPIVCGIALVKLVVIQKIYKRPKIQRTRERLTRRARSFKKTFDDRDSHASAEHSDTGSETPGGEQEDNEDQEDLEEIRDWLAAEDGAREATFAGDSDSKQGHLHALSSVKVVAAGKSFWSEAYHKGSLEFEILILVFFRSCRRHDAASRYCKQR